jgi:hypothetical protein
MALASDEAFSLMGPDVEVVWQVIKINLNVQIKMPLASFLAALSLFNLTSLSAPEIVASNLVHVLNSNAVDL